MKKPLLMTGATGLVGSRFAEMFADTYDVANIDLATGVDITDIASIEKFVTAHPSESLIHLAAFTDTNKAFGETGDKSGICYKVNVDGTRNIAKVCHDHGIHLVHISTDFVFDGKKDTPYQEDDPLCPIEWYGQTKAWAEEEVEKSDANYTIARLSYPYRAHYELKPDIVQKIRSGLESGKLYPQFTDTVITPTYIDDIARGFDAIVRLKPGGIFHLTGSSWHSPYELAQMVAKAYGFDPGVVRQGSLTEYLKSANRPFARTVKMANDKAKKKLILYLSTFEEGLAAIKS